MEEEVSEQTFGKFERDHCDKCPVLGLCPGCDPDCGSLRIAIESKTPPPLPTPTPTPETAEDRGKRGLNLKLEANDE